MNTPGPWHLGCPGLAWQKYSAAGGRKRKYANTANSKLYIANSGQLPDGRQPFPNPKITSMKRRKAPEIWIEEV
jgi:hypothetical protein